MGIPLHSISELRAGYLAGRWSASEAVGAFVARLDAPHAIGKVELDDGRWVSGFLCDPLAMQGEPDIGRFGGWRAWQSAGAPLD